jgi:hypothetical protein
MGDESELTYVKYARINGVNGEECKPGQYKVIDAKDVEAWTTQGWALVHPYQDHEVMTAHESQAVMGVGGYPTTLATTKSHLGLVTRYLIRKAPDAVQEELRDRIRKLQNEAGLVVELRRQLANVEAVHNETQKRLESSQQEVESIRKDREAFRASARKLETDLGKLREAIGAMKFNEIVGVKS